MALSDNFREIASLSPAQHSTLRLLSQVGHDCDIQAIAQLAGLHPSTVRETLEVLVDKKLVRRTRRPASGRGRPAWIYEIATPESSASFHRHFSDLLRSVIEIFILDPGEGAEADQAANKGTRERTGVAQISFRRAEQLGRRWGDHYIRSAQIPDHRLFSKLTGQAQLEVHISKIRVFLSALGFEIQTAEQPTEIMIRSFPVWSDDPIQKALISRIYQSMIDRVLLHLSRGACTCRLTQLPGQDNFIYLAELRFLPPRAAEPDSD